MTEIERKALALLRECAEVPAYVNLQAIPGFVRAALFRAIEQHEAFKQEVSDAVEKLLAWPSIRSQAIIASSLARFIIAKPVDPLVDILADAFWDIFAIPQKAAEAACEAIEKRGGKIVWGEG